MGRYLNVGNAGFENVVSDVYVDKTGLIEYMNGTLGTKKKMTCVSRPRRFGKSFAAQMLCAYYDKSCDSGRLFENLYIAQTRDYQRYLNKFDVVYLDITWFIAKSKEKNEERNVVEILNDEVVSDLQKAYPEVAAHASLPEMLLEISEATGSLFIFIIDEWDALFREAKDNQKLQEEYIRLLRVLFKSSGSTDKTIAGAYMTGILPIKKYGTQSALTDFKEFTMLRPEPLEEYVGFTEDEVKRLCEGVRLKFEDIQRWYDGYELGEHVHIYSPNSVMEALVRGRIGNYWTQSETYESLKLYIDMNEEGLQEAVSRMLCGEHIPLDVETFQNDMVSIGGRDDVLTLLVHLGYLVYHYDEEAVSIPNEEVKKEFMRAVRKSAHRALIRLVRQSEMLLDATIAMDSETVARGIAEVHSSETAPAFYNNEQALRSVIRMAYLTCIDDYREIQELPGGTGYADMVFIPKKRSVKPAMVIELKWNRTADTAIRQIRDRNYPQALDGLADDILLVGVNYDERSKEHTCVIEKYRA